jgi:hypothetical protein
MLDRIAGNSAGSDWKILLSCWNKKVFSLLSARPVKETNNIKAVSGIENSYKFGGRYDDK